MTDVDTRTQERMQQVQGLMVFLGSLADGLESLLGKGSQAVCLRSGRIVGLKRTVAKREDDLFKALDAVRQEMQDMGINWPFKLYKKKSEKDIVSIDEDGFSEIKMPFRDCMVRCTLFRYGFPQEMSLCQTKHGLFCGLFENIYGVKATLGIEHSGENACLLKLRFKDKKR